MPAVGFVPLQAPLPSPRNDDLLAVAPPVGFPSTKGWLGGGWSEGAPPGPAFVHDPCSGGTERVKMGGGDIAAQRSRIFNVYLTAECTAQSVGTDPDWFINRLKDALRVYESAAVERVLATGDGHTTVGPYLGDENLEILNGGLAADPVKACGLLEQAVLRHGGGIIHLAPRTFVAWSAARLVGPGNRTALGTPVAVGYGYVGVTPDAGPPPTPTQEWAFASGPIEIVRGQIDVPASAYAQILDRSMNDVTVIAERPYLLNWIARQHPGDGDHVQAGVLVDLNALATNFIVVGSGVAYTIETPAGAIDGLNDTFTLATTPVPAADLLLWKNGLFMTQGTDYTLAGNTITFDPDQIPPALSVLIAAVPG